MSVTKGVFKIAMRKFAYMQRFGLARTESTNRLLTPAFLSQLSYCKSDSARRLLLGVSQKFTKERAA